MQQSDGLVTTWVERLWWGGGREERLPELLVRRAYVLVCVCVALTATMREHHA